MTHKNKVCKQDDGLKNRIGSLVGLRGGSWQPRAGAAHRLVVELDDERAELAHANEVAAHDVDALGPRPLLARPAEKQRQRAERQRPHALERVTEDVRNVLRQVQAGDVKTSWKVTKEMTLLGKLNKTNSNLKEFCLTIFIYRYFFV